MDANEHIKCACPNCQKKLSVEFRYAGKKGRCPQCKNVFTIPSSDSQANTLAAELPPQPEETSFSKDRMPPEAAKTTWEDQIHNHPVPEKRKRTIWIAGFACAGLVVVGLIGYFVFYNKTETEGVKTLIEQFLECQKRGESGETYFYPLWHNRNGFFALTNYEIMSVRICEAGESPSSEYCLDRGKEAIYQYVVNHPGVLMDDAARAKAEAEMEEKIRVNKYKYGLSAMIEYKAKLEADLAKRHDIVAKADVSKSPYAYVVVRIDSSNKGGLPIRTDWIIYVEKTEDGLLGITGIYEQ